MADTQTPETTGAAFERLVSIMQRLRDPASGCPWDVEQTFETIAPYTIEEAYEVAEAINRGDMAELKEELGDLAFQVVFHSQMASEQRAFDVTDVLNAISEKMLRRHPHVFEEADQRSADDQTVAWEAMKAAERAEKAVDDRPASALDGVALALPALMRAEKLQKRAARTGFDWTGPAQILDKFTEEANEVREAIAAEEPAEIEEEVGDLLFVCANLARRLGVDPEVALRKANDKFERRFRGMEALAGTDGARFAELDLEAQDQLWSRVKSAEKAQKA